MAKFACKLRGYARKVIDAEFLHDAERIYWASLDLDVDPYYWDWEECQELVGDEPVDLRQ